MHGHRRFHKNSGDFFYLQTECAVFQEIELKLFSKKQIEYSDEELVLRYRQSADPALLGQLYERYLHLVYGLCLKYLKNRDDAQDAVMAVYERLGDKLMRHEVAHFRSWLYVVVKNHCLMALRQKDPTEKMNGVFMETLPDVHPTEEPDLMESELTALEQCMETLKAEQRQCVRLFYLEQKSYSEVSTLTAFDLHQVKSYIQNGKRNLKICLESKNVR